MAIPITKSDFFEKIIIKFYAPKLKHKTNFFRLLAVAQKAWLGIREALISIKISEQHKWVSIILKDLINQLTQWETLSNAMKNHDYFFKTDEISLISAAETMGNLPEILNDIAEELENLQEINQKITKAITYPIILISLSAISIIILLTVVMPIIVQMFPDKTTLPPITKFMLWLSDFLSNARILVIAIFVGTIILFKALYEFVLPFKIIIDKLMVNIPVVSGVTKTFYMYRFSKLLWQFYSAGISPVVALDLISDIFKNFLYKKKTKEIKEDLETWFSFFEAMEWSNLFDPILIQIIHVWEDTWDINTILLKISSFYHKLLKNKISILLSIIEPMLMVFVAIIIWLIFWSIFLPIIDMVDTIQ